MTYLIVIVVCCAITLYIHNQMSNSYTSDIEEREIELRKAREILRNREADFEKKQRSLLSQIEAQKNNLESSARMMLRNREAELASKFSALSKQKEELESRSRVLFALDKIFPIEELNALHKVTSDTERELGINRGRAQKYVQRLLRLNEDKKAAFRERPILAVSTSILSSTQLFNVNRETFLQRERELCMKRLSEDDLDITQIDITTTLKECQVVYVVDGDTYDIVINNNKYRIRAAGFDTPEVCHPKKGFGHWAFKASEAAKRIIENGKVFHVALDTEGYKQRWCNDRYGRIVAHITVDGELIGRKLLKEGNAEFVDVFPLDTAVREEYEKSEHFAKINNAGMWDEINRFNLEKKKLHEKSKWTPDTIQNNHKDIVLTTSLLKDMMKEMLGNMVIKSKNSIILHKEDCFHTRKMSESESVSVTDDMISNSNNIRPCKHCHGDDLSLELYGVT